MIIVHQIFSKLSIMKKSVFLFTILVIALVAFLGCESTNDPVVVEDKPTYYQFTIDKILIEQLFQTPNFYKTLMGGSTCWVELGFYNIVLSELNSESIVIEQYQLATGTVKKVGGYKSVIYTAKKSAYKIRLSFRVDIAAHKGDHIGISKPTMYRSFEKTVDLDMVKENSNTYNLTCGTYANVLMIGGQSLPIDNW